MLCVQCEKKPVYFSVGIHSLVFSVSLLLLCLLEANVARWSMEDVSKAKRHRISANVQEQFSYM